MKEKVCKTFRLATSYMLVCVFLITSLTACGDTGSKIDKKLQKAEKYLEAENYDKAIELYEEILEDDAKNKDAYFGLVDAHVGDEDYDAALKVLNKAVKKIDNEYIEAVRDYFEYWMSGGNKSEWVTADIYKKAKNDKLGDVAVASAVDSVSRDEGSGNETIVSPDTVVPVEQDQPVAQEVALDPFTGEPYLRDEYGKILDFGGQEFIIRDWYSTGGYYEPTNAYEETRINWREHIQETYNFSIRAEALSTWGGITDDLRNYNPNRDGLQFFVLPDTDTSYVATVKEGYAYDLSTLDSLNFSNSMFSRNNMHKKYARGSSIYGMSAAFNEPYYGVYVNTDLLRYCLWSSEDDLLNLLVRGEWTWDVFDSLCRNAYADTNNDGETDVFPLTCNTSALVAGILYSNGGSAVTKNSSGQYVFNLDSGESRSALEFAQYLLDYFTYIPEGASWDYGREEFANGRSVFYIGSGYMASLPYTYFNGIGSEVLYLPMPKGPGASGYSIPQYGNVTVIPSNVSRTDAEKMALVWSLYNMIPGFEDYVPTYEYTGYGASFYNSDTMVEVMNPSDMLITYDTFLCDYASTFLYDIADGYDIESTIDYAREYWDGTIRALNY